ncbi:MAG TPA: OmpA family protein [Bacteroidales bacterium]|nr:OmpA family protein [Bacteroidales bacterium]
MRILIIGFLALFGWSALSVHIYVCKIKGLCNEPVTMQIDTLNQKDVIAVDTLAKSVVQEKEVIPEDLVIYFAFDKSVFNSDEKTDKYFDESNAFLNQNSQFRLSITGHTDAIGTDEYNEALGYRRAKSVQHYFESKGMPSNKIIIESKGEKETADNNSTVAGRANNRRTVITIIK